MVLHHISLQILLQIFPDSHIRLHLRSQSLSDPYLPAIRPPFPKKNLHCLMFLMLCAEKARKNRNIPPCLLQCALFVTLYNSPNYPKILFYAICQFRIIYIIFSNFLLTFALLQVCFKKCFQFFICCNFI